MMIAIAIAIVGKERKNERGRQYYLHGQTASLVLHQTEKNKTKHTQKFQRGVGEMDGIALQYKYARRGVAGVMGYVYSYDT
jgi:hypothetical protein